ncbi:hypothetical protein GUJ93_ZPchr0010g8432 [Zizania palustris]|uniref:Apyrase 7 n=1 Tax=Zizania palustris TaxID=103762 RepID=A0A8J5WBH8_ZIZPA|nr:hypothetical protein GUJ93_ZPchr0010g8432 [Zizania palustris]
METEPGLNKLVHNETGLKMTIEPLLRMAEKMIPRRAHKHTPAFLYATAGVRKLPSADSEWLLDKAWDVLKNSSFLCSRDRVKIISGMEEAYYGWIALNHHLNMLGTSSSKMTYGSLDLGGSSLQVTFETDTSMKDDTSISLRIGSVRHQLSAYSLSGYGLNDAFDKSVAHLVKKLGGTAGNGKVQVKHPCLQTGYKEDYSCSYCHSLKLDGSPSVGTKTTGKEKQGTTVELVGAPQWNECSALAKVTVNLSEWSNASYGVDFICAILFVSNSIPRSFRKSYLPLFRQNNAGNPLLSMGSPFRFHLWSHITSGDARTKTPLSPVAGSVPHPFSMSHGLGGNGVQLMESSRQSLGVYHSYSVGSLGQMQFSSGMWKPGQTTLQSRRSQSREDLTSSLADLHVPKV